MVTLLQSNPCNRARSTVFFTRIFRVASLSILDKFSVSLLYNSSFCLVFSFCFLIHSDCEWANCSALRYDTRNGTATRTPLDGFMLILILRAFLLRSSIIGPTPSMMQVFVFFIGKRLKIGRAFDGDPGPIQNVGVDHRGGNIRTRPRNGSGSTYFHLIVSPLIRAVKRFDGIMYTPHLCKKQ